MTLKRIGKTMHTFIVIHIMGITNIMYFAVIFIFFDTPVVQTGYCYWNLTMVGFTSFFVHFLYSRAYQEGDMVMTSLFEFTQCFIGMAFDILIMGKVYNVLSYVGLFVLSASLIGDNSPLILLKLC